MQMLLSEIASFATIFHREKQAGSAFVITPIAGRLLASDLKFFNSPDALQEYLCQEPEGEMFTFYPVSTVLVALKMIKRDPDIWTEFFETTNVETLLNVGLIVDILIGQVELSRLLRSVDWQKMKDYLDLLLTTQTGRNIAVNVWRQNVQSSVILSVILHDIEQQRKSSGLSNPPSPESQN